MCALRVTRSTLVHYRPPSEVLLPPRALEDEALWICSRFNPIGVSRLPTRGGGSRAHARDARLRDLSKLLPRRKSALVGNSRESDFFFLLRVVGNDKSLKKDNTNRWLADLSGLSETRVLAGGNLKDVWSWERWRDKWLLCRDRFRFQMNIYHA